MHNALIYDFVNEGRRQDYDSSGPKNKHFVVGTESRDQTATSIWPTTLSFAQFVVREAWVLSLTTSQGMVCADQTLFRQVDSENEY